ncbi:MAG: hypothetical protein ETSY1_42995 [Candidatus Entotheonella factor]|uniref:DUF2283 domain-containing protein n=1 Tax=Entotheonella factor TaxID=1429438 RepID=W4L3H3_ENTF1|nr:MAG: hypothetical protein ETSY1_42995 [Candidatus Entotheonella factor]
MKLEYDAEADAAYIRLSDKLSHQTEEESDVCIVDYDEKGHVVAIELLSVFGFAGTSLYALVQKGLLSSENAESLLRELRNALVTA